MLFYLVLLTILFMYKHLVSSAYIPGHQGNIMEKDRRYQHAIAKRTVPLKDELEFYETVNRIKPETLKLLMPNITEEPYIRTLPSDRCCFNGGTCYVPTYERADRYCTCPPNFMGRYCFEDVDECESPKACGQHEVCKNTYGSYNCSCQQGYIREGLRCTRKINCYEDPCLNFSDCVDVEDGRILCICRLGFKGTRCEIRVRECEDSSCNEDDICVATPDGFQCIKI